MTRTEKLDLRLTPSAKRVLQSAAAATQRSVSDRFGLDAERWAAFQAALDSPARPDARLKKLLTKPSVFERRRRG